MASYNPTIIAASLSDEELQKSINALVNKVKDGTDKMKMYMTDAVKDMKAQLQSLGSVNITTGGSSDGGATRRAKIQKEETDAVKANTAARKEQTATLDQQAAALQKATQPKSARESFYAFAQGFKEQAQYLQQLINQWESLQLARRIGDFNAIGVSIDQTTQKINALKTEITQLRKDQPTGYRDQIKERETQIDLLKQKVVDLRQEQQRLSNAPIGDNEYIRRYREQLEYVNNALRDGSMIRQQQTSFTQQQIDKEEQLNRKIQRQAEIIRQRLQETGAAQSYWGSQVIYDPNAVENAKVKRAQMSIEEQLLAVHKEQMRITAQRIALEQQVEAEKRRDLERQQQQNAALQQQFSTEQAITQQVNQRRKYTTPEVSVNDAYRSMLANRLGIRQEELLKSGSSIKSMTAYLKQLEDAFNRLTGLERRSAFGKQLRIDMQETRRELTRLRSEASRPISFAAIDARKVRTLDDMAYKLRELQAYRNGIEIFRPNADKEIKQVDEAIRRLQKDMDKYMTKGREVNEINSALSRSWNYMKNRLAFYFTVGASTQFIKNLIDVRAQYEMNERALGILINSAERGTQIFQELSQMALVSPYTLIELSTAAKQLTAYDVAAKDVVDTTRRLADMTAAVGIPIERLTYALGQIKAYGYLNARDARMFSNAGIPLVKQLSDYYTELEGKMVSVSDIYDRINKKAIGYNEVMQVIYKMTDEGGKFFDFQAKMADTLKVRLANLTLAWNNMLNDIGKSTQGMLTWTINGLKELFLHWKQFDSAIKSIAWAAGLTVAMRALNVVLVKCGFQWGILSKQMTTAGIAGQAVSRRMATLGAAMRTVATSSITYWALLALAIVDVSRAIINAGEAQKEFNKSVRDGAKDNYENITQFLNQYKELRDSLTKEIKTKNGSVTVANDIDKNDATKAWEKVREQIELTSRNADEYIGRLNTIKNVSERLRQGFALLDDLQSVNAAIKELGDDAIKLTPQISAWWNAWLAPDGLLQNLKDYHLYLGAIADDFGSIEKARKAAQGEYQGTDLEKAVDKGWQNRAKKAVEDLDDSLEKLKNDVAKTSESILRFISNKGWEGQVTKINETFSQVIDKLVLENNLSPQEAFTLQMEVENARTEAVKQAYVIRINDEKAALTKARDENSKAEIQARLDTLKQEQTFFLNNTKESRVYWRDFTKWMGEQHKSEVHAMFKDMDARQIASLDFEKGEYYKWATDLAHKYAEEHNMAYEEVFRQLKNYITSANQWSIRIPLIISTEDKKTEYETLEDADKAADAAWQKIQRLEKRKSELKAKGASYDTSDQATDNDKEYIKVINEITDAQTDYNRAIEQGGHSKKESAAGRKAQKAAESELQKALKEEISLLDKARSTYKSLKKEGVSSTEAIAVATSGYEKTLAYINNVLSKYGIAKVDITKYAGVQNPKVVMDMLQAQLDTLSRSGLVKPEEIKDLEVKLKDLKVDAVTFNQKTLSDSLNNELSKLKDEYEIGLEFDATPELGSMFQQMMGLSDEELAQLPKDFEGVVKKLQSIVDTEMGQGKFDVGKNLNKKVFDQYLKDNQIDVDSDLANRLRAMVDFANDVRQKETKKQIDDWDKLLEKYAEYEYKRNKIAEDAERERQIARKKGASQDILNAIDIRERQQLAKLNMEEFMKTSTWITATGDLSTLSSKAIGVLIDRLEDYKKHAKDLDPKQIKQLNSALSKLYKEQRKNSPFKAISDMLAQARERFLDYEREINQAEADYAKLSAKAGTVGLTGDEEKLLVKLIERIKELKQEQEEVSTPDAEQWVASIQTTIAAVKEAIGVFQDLAKAINGVNGDDDLDKALSVLDKAASSAATGAAVAGGWGAAIGAVVGTATGLLTTYIDKWNGNAGINKAIEDSERAIKRLELAYVDLEHAVSKAYGTEIIGAKRALAAAKELELAELERQLRLEQSRKSKNRDNDKILDLQKQIKELRYEIQDSIEEITDDLLGSDVGSFAENLVSSMIDAFKKGEDYMKVFEDKFDEMIDNMIMKSIVSRIITAKLDQLWNDMTKSIDDRTKQQADEYAAAKTKREELESQTFEEWVRNQPLWDSDKRRYKTEEELLALWEAEKEAAKQAEEAAKDALDVADDIKDEDILSFIAEIEKVKPEIADTIKAALNQWYTFGEDSDKNLSALQQGISQISETTANALEAYMNIVAQRMFEQGTILAEIRDALATFDLDVQVSTMGQILLQLQNSYQVQMSIQGILQGWSNANGMAVRVEMV